jgi:subtilisin-like proprotein convertase family protein
VSRSIAASPGVLILLTLAVLLAVGLGAAHAGTQTSCPTTEYASSGPPLAIPDPGSVDASLSVPSGGEVESLTVGVDITHPFDSDLHLQLVSPAGTVVELAHGVGMWGHDFTGTVFDDQAAGSIVSQLPPFTGDFRPIEPLSTLQGSAQGGTWKLRVTDRIGGYSGQLDSWKLDITSCASVSPPTPVAGATTTPPLPSGVPAGALPVQGTPITVTAGSDDSDGDVSSVANLLGNPGSDGTISLREAIQATNNDPGTYTIQFDPSLAGSTISITGAGGSLPPLTGGHVLIDGDTNGDGLPDITIAAGTSNPNWAFDVASSGNRIHALGIRGFSTGVLFTAGPQGIGSLPTGQTYDGDIVDGNVLTDIGQEGIQLSPVIGRAECSPTAACQTTNSWTNMRLVGNTINTGRAGVDAQLADDVGDSFSQTTIAGNNIVFPSGGSGLTLLAGDGGGADENQIADTLVAYNEIQGSGSGSVQPVAITAVSGRRGGSANGLHGLDILGNEIQFTGEPEPGVPSRGILLGMSDGCSGGPGIDCSMNNVASQITIERNAITGPAEGVLVDDACCGGPPNGSTLSDVAISGNVIKGIIPPDALDPWGVLISSAGAVVSHVNVDSNTIEQDQTEPQLAHNADLAGGGVAVVGDLGGQNGSIQTVSISNNQIDSDLAGITLVGGGPSDEASADDAFGNVVSDVQLTGNVIGREPTLATRIDPQVRGISLIGGLGGTPPATGNWKASTDNSVTSVTVQGNLVAGVMDDVSVQSNFGAGASGNTAALGLRPPTLSVAMAGDGTVTSDPPGINCPLTCSAAFDDRSEVTLSAAAGARSTFAGWSGGGCSGDATCTVTMNGDESVTATFKAICVVPKLKGKRLPAARTAIKRAHCSVGKITRVKSSKKSKNRVIAQSPKAGAHRAEGSKIALKVGK